MTNLEKLYEMSKSLDAQLAEINSDQKVIETEIKEKRKTRWEEIFDDILSLRKYSRYLDTGISLYGTDKTTLGFEIRENFIMVISWSHFYDGGGKRPEPYLDTMFFAIYKDKPFYTTSHYERWMEYVLQAAENWSTVFPEMQRRLEEKMKRDMQKKVIQAEEKQKRLDAELFAISS
ncbi:MAG: hypothetical protein UHN47_05590 [Lachnospiraceae bacterium]|nr:hypothetical protein [Lachnospiraceae bacterium]